MVFSDPRLVEFVWFEDPDMDLYRQLDDNCDGCSETLSPILRVSEEIKKTSSEQESFSWGNG